MISPGPLHGIDLEGVCRLHMTPVCVSGGARDWDGVRRREREAVWAGDPSACRVGGGGAVGLVAELTLMEPGAGGT
jgi:hypothetical protein